MWLTVYELSNYLGLMCQNGRGNYVVHVLNRETGDNIPLKSGVIFNDKDDILYLTQDE